MKVELTAIEARVIGCLIEKEVTTPRPISPQFERVDQRM